MSTLVASVTDLGKMLIDAGVITQEQWQQAFDIHQREGKKIDQVLVEQRLVTPQQLALFISLQMGVPFVNLKKQEIQPEALELVPEQIARKHGAMPLEVNDGALVVAMEDPRDLEALEDLAILTRRRVEPVLGTREDIREALDLNYRASAEIEKQLSQIHGRAQKTRELESRVSAEAIAQAPVVRALDLLIRQAVRDRASDVHIEPQENKLRIRSRIDGILHEVLSLPLSVHPPLVSRLKVMAGMNIAERRRPQDGQITFLVGEREVDIRVAVSPTVFGEMAVLRILDKTFAFRALSELGFLPEAMEKYQRMLASPFGMVLVSGPTGAGKTTTLYASVNQIDSTGLNIITVEDPVEYRFMNINQIQVNPAAGVTFATGLRGIMRLDPDVILVGEIRDSETAQIAIQAALTGHLMLSSVHANDAVGVMFRLLDLGAEPFMVAAGLVGVVAQRMVRRVCPHCLQLSLVTAEERTAYEKEMNEERSEFLVGRGCNFCAHTGYLGRTGIFEVLDVSETIRRMLLKDAGTDEIRAQAWKEGMVSLWHDGMVKVKMGLTTPYEVIRNVFSMTS
ncbi:MAG: GspE/PulE family protein [Dehalococcoidia bacterium]